MNTTGKSRRSFSCCVHANAFLALACLVALLAFMVGCSSNSSSSAPPPASVTVNVLSSSSSVLLGNTQQLTVTVMGTSNTTVTWSVNGVAGGNSTVGTITNAGLYTAPADLPSPATVTISATSQANTSASGTISLKITSDIALSVSTVPAGIQSVSAGTTLQLQASVTSAGHPDEAVNWSVNGVTNGNSNVGSISLTGSDTATYTAPTNLSSPLSVTVAATSVADIFKQGSVAFQDIVATPSVTSVSNTSPTPLTPIYIETTGLNVSAPVTIQFSNSAGFSVSQQPIRVASDGTVVAASPLYVDPASGQIGAGTASLVLTQASLSSAPVTINIQNLPSVSSYGTELGQISHSVLIFEAMLLGRRLNELQAFQVLPGNSVDTTAAQSTLQTLLNAVIKARSDVDRVMVDNSVVIGNGTLPDGTVLQFDQNSLDMMDRILGIFLSQTFETSFPASAATPGANHVLKAAQQQTSTFSLFLGAIDSINNTLGFEQDALQASNSGAITDQAAALSSGSGTLLGAASKLTGTVATSQKLGALGSIFLSLKVAGEAYGDLAAYGVALASGNQTLLNTAVSEMNSIPRRELYGALTGVVSAGFFPEVESLEAVSTVLGLAQTVSKVSQAAQAADTTTLNILPEFPAPFSSDTEGIGIVKGNANVNLSDPEGVVGPQSGLNLCCFGASALGITDIVDASGDYQLSVPLQVPGTSYNNLTLSAVDPLTPSDLASETVDLSALTTAAPMQVPQLASASGAPSLTIPLGQTLSGCVDPTGGTVNAQTLVAFGGAPLSGYNWTLANLSVFPPGTTVDQLTGVFHGNSGTVVVGTYTFTMNVTDGSSSVIGTFSLTVDSSTACGIEVFEQSSLTTITLPHAKSGSGYGAGLFVGGGTPPYTWSLGTGSSLPGGLVIDMSRGVVRGTPLSSASGQTFSFTVNVTDSIGEVAVCPNGGLCPTYQITVQ
jgi:hypothetical protein